MKAHGLMTSKSTHKTKIAIIFLVGYLTNLLILFLGFSLKKASYYGMISAMFIALLLGFIYLSLPYILIKGKEDKQNNITP